MRVRDLMTAKPITVDPELHNASLRSWNVNVQRQLGGSVAAMVVYYGSRGTDLRISRNLNQPINGVRPYPTVSAASPIQPGATLGNITQAESTGFSRYHAVSATVSKRSRDLLFDTSYTWSKSLDTNSLNSSNFNVQDGYDISNQYGLSDFDARHRFVRDPRQQQHRPRSEEEAEHAAGHREQQTLDQHLPHESESRSPKRRTYRKLLAPRRRTRQQKIGDVRARDQ